MYRNEMQGFGAAPFWHNGPTPGQFYNFMGDGSSANVTLPEEYTAPGNFGTQHSYSPITTGTTVMGIKFDGGVMIAADTVVSYGSLARFRDVERVFKVNEHTILGASNDFADFQHLKRSIDQKMTEDMCYNDNIAMKPRSLCNWLTRIQYNRRCRMKPYFLEMVVGGMNDGEPFLGHVDERGRAYEDDVVATGLGKHLVLPIVRESLGDAKKPLTQTAASNLLRKCMEVLFYRDCRAVSKFMVAIATKEGTVIEGPFDVSENWALAAMVKGF